jgi:sugar lactone lactonase YvrE
VVEGKIDLDDLGSPEGLVAIAQIRVMAGDTPPSETWRAVDEFNPRMQGLTWVNEVDETKESDTAIQNPAADEPPSEEPSQPAPHNFKSDTPLEERAKYVWLEERGEYAEYIYRQFHQNAQQVAWGPDGYLYIADGAGKHIVRVAPDGTLDDLGIWKDHIYMQEYGPNGIAFDLEGNLLFNTGPHMYKRSPDGTIEYLFSAEHGNIRNITVDEKGVMYYSLNTGPIYQWNPDGEDIFLTDEYHDPQIYMAPNGQLYISDYGMNRVIVFDVNTKESRVFAEGLFGPEGTYLRVDPEGDLWARGTPFGYQFSPEGELKPFTIDGQPSEYFRWHLAGDITFDPDGNLWVTYASGEILRLTPDTPGQPDPNSFTSEIISESFEASDLAIGPEGEVYATNLVPGNIWRFNPDGSHEIIWQHGDQGRVGIAVDDQGVI